MTWKTIFVLFIETGDRRRRCLSFCFHGVRRNTWFYGEVSLWKTAGYYGTWHYTREREEEIIKADWVQGHFKDVWIDYFYTTADFTEIVFSMGNIQGNSWIVNGLKPGRYYWRVIIEDAQGHTQVALDAYKDEEGQKHYGVREFTVK